MQTTHFAATRMGRGFPGWNARSEVQPMVTPLGKPSDNADRPDKRPGLGLA